MRNLPEDELFDKLGDRLRHYREEPDDQLWGRIAAASAPQKTAAWIKFADPIALVASVIFLLSVSISEINSSDVERSAEREEIKTGSDKVKSSVRRQESIRKELVEKTSQLGEILGNAKVSEIQPVMKMSSPSKSNIIRPVKIKSNTISTEAVSFAGNDQEEQILSTPLKNEIGNEDAFDPSVGNSSIRSFNTISSSDEIEKDSIVITTVTTQDSTRQTKKPVCEIIKKNKKGLNFYASITPLLSYYKVDPLENDGIVIDEIQGPTTFSKNRLGISVEFGVQGTITKRLEYYGGISYSQQKVFLNYQYRSETGNEVESTNSSLTFDIDPENHTRQLEYQKKNLGIQAGILYELRGGPLVQKIGGGFLYQQGIQKRVDNETYNNARSSYLFYQLVYRNEYSLNNALKIFMQPNFTRAIYSNEQLNKPFKVRPYWVGISVGVIYKF